MCVFIHVLGYCIDTYVRLFTIVSVYIYIGMYICVCIYILFFKKIFSDSFKHFETDLFAFK